MPRIQGVDLPPDKPTHISLRYLLGFLQLSPPPAPSPALSAEPQSLRRLAALLAIIGLVAIVVLALIFR